MTAEGISTPSHAVVREARRGAVFISYNGLLDPLGRSQILGYIERLNREWPVHVISFERKHKLSDTSAVRAMEKRLAAQNLGWIRLRYHQKPSLPATTYDMLRGVVALRQLMARSRIGLIHARGYVPMEIASNATRRTPILFDIRGLQAEEYVDAGSWKEGELKWRLAKRSERRFFRKAAGAVVLTEAIKPHIERRFVDERVDGIVPPVEVVPCCVDLERFKFDAAARAQRRAALGVGDDVTVFLYSGSLGSWYLADEMAKLVRTYRDATREKCFLLWSVNNDLHLASSASDRAGLSSSEYRIISSSADDVPGVISAADVGLALIKPCFSKKSSSPTKYAEYLSIGLPVVINRDVGDGSVLERERVAAAFGATIDEAEYRAAVHQITALRKTPRDHFRRTAEKLFDVDRVAIPSYRRLYTKLIEP